MQVRFSKAEIIDRIIWVNLFRIAFGCFFFFGLVVLNLFDIYLASPTFVLVLIGIFILMYAGLTHYYLVTQKTVLAELVFLTVFLTAVDLFCITGFIYFSGGIESPYVPLYILILASVPVSMPQLPYAVFFWAFGAALLYDAVIILTYFDLIPFYSRQAIVVALGQANLRLSVFSCFLAPAIDFFFAFAAFSASSYIHDQRAKLEVEMARETELGKKAQGFAEVHWILTHVLKPEAMLNQALKKLLEVLHLSSGLILTLEPREGLACRARQGVPPELMSVFIGKSLKEAAVHPANLKEIVVAGEAIQNIFNRKLIFHKKELGLLVIFGKEGEEWLEPRMAAPLDAIVDEVGAAVFYSKFFCRFGREKKKE